MLTVQGERPQIDEGYFLKYMAVLRSNLDYVLEIKAAISKNDLTYGAQLWWELDEETQSYLWKAPSKGGIFTTREKEAIRGFKRCT